MKKNVSRFAIVLGFAVAGLALAASGDQPQSKSEAAAVREAVRFQRSKDAADRQQLRTGGLRPAVPALSQASRANRGEADRMAEPQSSPVIESPGSDAAAVADAIRFERFKDAAAARQMRKASPAVPSGPGNKKQ